MRDSAVIDCRLLSTMCVTILVKNEMTLHGGRISRTQSSCVEGREFESQPSEINAK